MKKGFLKSILVTLMVGVMTVSLAGCGSSTKSDKDKLDVVKENGKIVVGMSADYAPYEFHAIINGQDKVVGFDVDLANEIAKDLGVELEIKEMDFDALISALKADQVDAVISGMNPTESRKQQVDFSDIYYEANHAILTTKNAADSFKTKQDLDGKVIGVQLGSTQQQIAEEEIKAGNVSLLQDVNSLILSLKTGKVDALITEKPVAAMAVENNPELAVSEIDFEAEGGGNAVGVKKGSSKLVESINKTIQRLKESGDLDKYIIEANDLAAKNQNENK
ncbi:MAG: transporter substrate-binding domain-containing protein [Clostridium sp.]|jgi:polar amino acid transport system substrate-binding protein|nr:transporter substrate-binding domain-containing protein [Clostridium sp.]